MRAFTNLVSFLWVNIESMIWAIFSTYSILGAQHLFFLNKRTRELIKIIRMIFEFFILFLLYQFHSILYSFLIN